MVIHIEVLQKGTFMKRYCHFDYDLTQRRSCVHFTLHRLRVEWPGWRQRWLTRAWGEERRPVAALWHRGQLPIPGHCEHPDPGEQMSPHHHQCRIVTILIPGTNVITNNLMTRSQITRTINSERVEQMMRPGSGWMRSLFHRNSCLWALKWVKFTRVSSFPPSLCIRC